jgi:hypothetical protein
MDMLVLDNSGSPRGGYRDAPRHHACSAATAGTRHQRQRHAGRLSGADMSIRGMHVTSGGRSRLVAFLVAALLVGSCGNPTGPDNSIVVTPNALAIPLGSRATIDGEISPGEWASARAIRLSFENAPSSSVTVDVRLMHDGAGLQVVYQFEAAAGILLAPELFLDTAHDRGPSLRNDDFWFHLSGSDCSNRGAYDDYSTCTMSAWWETGPRPHERLDREVRVFELRIPFSGLGVATGSEIGIAIRIMHTARVADEWVTGTFFWPLNGSPDSPDSWELAQLL